jgi:hypothetical protein
VSAKLISRHWIITDSDGKVQEVRGKGVVGEQGREFFEAVVERGRMMDDVIAEQPGTRAEVEQYG